MDLFDSEYPDEMVEAHRMTEADRADLRTFVWMSALAFVFAILLWLGLCNHV